MSTRRTTRATSRAASSRGASPVITESDIPGTPSGRRTLRRAALNTPLPPIGTRTSTAYGSNSTVQPSSMRGPEIADQINNVLTGLLEPVHEEEAPSVVSTRRGGRTTTPRVSRGVRGGRRAASATPAAERSFQNESGIFGDAGIESSILDSSELGGIPEIPEPSVSERVTNNNVTQQESARRVQQQILEDTARTPVARRVFEQANTANGPFSAFISQCRALPAHIKSILLWIWSYLKTPLGVVLMTTFAIVTLWVFTATSQVGRNTSIRSYGFDIRHNIGQFIPYSIAHPISYFNPDEIKDLQIRMKAAEYDIAYLKKRSDLDNKAISKLEQLLPESIVCKRDKHGQLDITQEFWHALEAKMRSENAYLQQEVDKTDAKRSSKTSATAKEVERIMEKSKIWDKFLTSNRAKIMAWSVEEFDSRYPEKLRVAIDKAVIASKSEFIDLIRQKWDDAQKEIRPEVRQLAKELDTAVRRVRELEQNAVSHTREEVKVIATDIFKKLFSTTQLEGLSKANLNINANNGLRRVNHFSRGTGAVVNPRVTSPNFVFPSMDRNMLIKGLMWLVWRPIPRPNPAEVALQKWEEHGDCWCSPSKDSRGFGPSLGVIMGNNIYPDQVIVEHIATSAALEPGAAPKDMELLAFFDDADIYRAVKRRSEDMFEGERSVEDRHLAGWVRIGTWTYDAESLQNIQSFPLQVDLKMFRGPSHTNRLIVRSKNNWGGDNVGYTCLYRVRVNGEIAQPSA